MSVFLDLADKMVDRLKGASGLSGVVVLADKQRDLSNLFQRFINRHNRAGLIIVTWTGADNQDPDMIPPRYRAEYEVAVISKPIIRRGLTRADELVETAISRLHGWIPETNGHCHTEMRTGRSRLANSPPKLLVHAFNARADLQLPSAN